MTEQRKIKILLDHWLNQPGKLPPPLVFLLSHTETFLYQVKSFLLHVSKEITDNVLILSTILSLDPDFYLNEDFLCRWKQKLVHKMSLFHNLPTWNLNNLPNLFLFWVKKLS